MKLQRAQHGNIESPHDFNVVNGQHGYGVYAFKHGNQSMKQYYTKSGENLFSFEIPDTLVVDLSKKKMDFWEAKAYVYNNPQYKAFIFQHKGYGIPTAKEILITDPSIIQLTPIKGGKH